MKIFIRQKANLLEPYLIMQQPTRTFLDEIGPTKPAGLTEGKTRRYSWLAVVRSARASASAARGSTSPHEILHLDLAEVNEHCCDQRRHHSQRQRERRRR